jgi:hypothetical protein
MGKRIENIREIVSIISTIATDMCMARGLELTEIPDIFEKLSVSYKHELQLQGLDCTMSDDCRCYDCEREIILNK